MLLSFLLLYANIVENKDRVYAYIQASVIWALYLFVVTELLSLPGRLQFLPLFCVWAGAVGALLLLLIRRGKHRKCSLRLKGVATAAVRAGIRLPAVLGLGALGLIVLGFSLATVPYNWDSMTYHLSRITHWAQNGSVDHYATHILRQISSPVLAEFVNLHIYILTGHKDILFNLLQCACYLTSACMICQITRKLHGSRGISLFAALLYMSMPIAVSEAMTTQTDHFATLWLLYFVYLLLDFTGSQRIIFDRTTVGKVCTMGFCVSLGYLTKPSVCIAMALLLLWLLMHCVFRKDSPICLCRLLVCVIPTVLLPLIPETLQNLRTFSAISDSGVGQRQLIGTLHPGYMFINWLKNITFNFPCRYIPDSSNLLLRLVRKMALLLHVELNAPSISEDGREFFVHGFGDYGHDTAVNPLIMYLLALCILLGIAACRKYSLKRIVRGYSFIAMTCFMVFCAVLRWEPYVSRYMLSYLALLCPLIAIQLQNRLPRIPRYVLITSVILLCLADLSYQSAYHRIMMTRWGAARRPEGYFASRSTEYEPYTALCTAIDNIGGTSVGLVMGSDDYEYPLWKMFPRRVTRTEHIGVVNASADYADPVFQPDCIVWLGTRPDTPYEYNGRTYEKCIDCGEGHWLLCP